MEDIDDPLLALILRFVVPETNSDLTHEACMRLQVTLIQEHIATFPPADRQAHAIKWVEEHARRFREDCKDKLVATALADEARCHDCPLSESADGGPCVIHKRWATLVRRYVDKRLTSSEYVRDSLALLQAHKEQLKVTTLHREHPPEAST